jgi:tetratricopeptide (TPR) repeat protein
MPETGIWKKKGTITLLLIIVLVIGLVFGIKAYRRYQDRQGQLRFAAAESLYSNKNYLAAAREYETIAAAYPRSEHVTDCWYKAGYIYRNILFNDAAAALAFKKLLDLFPASHYRKETLLALMDIYARLGQYKEQSDILKKLQNEYPGAVNEDVLHLVLSKALSQQGLDKEAQQEMALIKDKNSNVVRNSQEYYQMLSAQDPFDPQPHLELARIYKGMGLQEKAVVEFETAKWIKKNAAEVKAAQQKVVAPSKYPRGFTLKKVPPKITLPQREEKLYIEYAVAQNKTWPLAMQKKSQGLGTPQNEKEAQAFGVKMQQYEKEWWTAWYAKNQTSYNECEKIRSKVINDQGTAILLNERIAKIIK